MKSIGFISPSRIAVIAGHTFTQLVRMKVFYFLVVFAVIMFGLQFIDMSQLGATQAVEQNLRVMKGAGFFAMNMFSVILALSATALLIPKDIEDRTLYTILCKPVPRLDYLIGKLLGVMSLVGVSLLVMDGLFCIILNSRVESMIAEQSAFFERMGRSPEFIATAEQSVRAQGVNANFQIGVFAVFLKALVVAAIALLVSTFATSTIFTIIITLVIVLIGLVQAEAREYFMQQQGLGKSTFMLEASRWVTLLFPDFKLLALEDGVINGKKISMALAAQVGWVAFLYSAIYTVLSWFVFSRKEL